MGRSLKAQLKQAGRGKAVLTLLMGGDELKAGNAIIKEMSTGEQHTVKTTDLINKVQDILESGGLG
jgi:histidyl-tRNA synthetase